MIGERIEAYALGRRHRLDGRVCAPGDRIGVALEFYMLGWHDAGPEGPPPAPQLELFGSVPAPLVAG